MSGTTWWGAQAWPYPIPGVAIRSADEVVRLTRSRLEHYRRLRRLVRRDADYRASLAVEQHWLDDVFEAFALSTAHREQLLASRRDPDWLSEVLTDAWYAQVAAAGGDQNGAPLRLRYAVEQDTALTQLADHLGYDTDAVRRAFRARFWRDSPTPEGSRARAPSTEPELSR